MLEKLKALFGELTGVAPQPPRFAENDYRLAAAALLIHVVSVDGQAAPAERAKLHTLLRAQFALDDAATDELIDAATRADREAVDLYAFTSQLNRALDEAGRLRVIEMMWEIIYADGRVNEFEDNLVWRAADLLGISSNDRIALRQRVRGNAAEGGDAVAELGEPNPAPSRG